MPALNTYIRKDIDKPLSRYAKHMFKTRGQIINELLKEKLEKEGFIREKKSV